MIVELIGLDVYGYHGVDAEERERGQRFLFDITLDVGDAGASDRIEDAVDYREVAILVREVSDAHKFQLLEALATAVTEALLARFEDIAVARVRVRKPDVALPVEHSAVTVERRR